MNWYLSALKKYAVFTGRARRKEYWFFQLINGLILIALLFVEHRPGTTMSTRSSLGFLSGLFVLAMFLPALGVLIRRLHDTGRSGWWVLIGLIPLVGPIVILVFTLQDGQPGTNPYGPNLKDGFSGSMAGGAAVEAK